jgi:alkylation response protein AidB-like acyl-CoA dehydrogenase
MLSSVAKLVGADAVVESALDLLRLHGSRGYHEGTVSDFLRDALAYCSVGGTEEMHRKNIMNQMVRSVERDLVAENSTAVEMEMPLRLAEAAG